MGMVDSFTLGGLLRAGLKLAGAERACAGESHEDGHTDRYGDIVAHAYPNPNTHPHPDADTDSDAHAHRLDTFAHADRAGGGLDDRQRRRSERWDARPRELGVALRSRPER
jgi:hypothetical protein